MGRIAYVDFGNVAQLSQQNKQVLIDAVVHAVNEDYDAMAGRGGGRGRLAPVPFSSAQVWSRINLLASRLFGSTYAFQRVEIAREWNLRLSGCMKR